MNIFGSDEKMAYLTNNHQIWMLVSMGWSLRVLDCVKIVLQPYTIQFYFHVLLMYCSCFVIDQRQFLGQNSKILINDTVYKQIRGPTK